MIDDKMPSVPEYYKEHINSKVDLVVAPKQCCPFHEEKTPSFSFDIKTGRWSCFGKCHAHGDVVEMHKRLYHFSTREEADRDLRIRYHVPEESYLDRAMRKSKSPLISQDEVEDNIVYATAIRLATTVDRWLELDYEMSKSPFDKYAVQELINKWTGVKSLLD